MHATSNERYEGLAAKDVSPMGFAISSLEQELESLEKAYQALSVKLSPVLDNRESPSFDCQASAPQAAGYSDVVVKILVLASAVASARHRLHELTDRCEL